MKQLALLFLLALPAAFFARGPGHLKTRSEATASPCSHPTQMEKNRQIAALLVDTTFLEAAVCSGDVYLFGDQPLTEEGEYQAIYLAADGTDSVVVLNLTVFPETPPVLRAETICFGETYLINGNELDSTGVYVFVLADANGCDSVIILELTVLPEVVTDIEASICPGDSYDFYGDELTEAGIYTSVFTDVTGCDSTIRLTLTELPTSLHVFDVSICEGESYDFEGDTLDTTGVYTVIYPNTAGCDSVITLNLSVFPHSEPGEIFETVCSGESYIFDGDTLNTTGIYTATFTNANGCDSVVTLNLTALPGFSSTAEIEASFCSNESYEFYGDTLTEGGVYTAVLTNTVGCDSTVTLTLTELPSSLTALTVDLCEGESYDFEGDTLTTSGFYSVTYLNTAGCDSTITLTLTVYPHSEPTDIAATICAGESYIFDGDTLTTSGIYPVVFTNANGCDSLVTLTLTALPGSDSASEIEASFCRGDSYEFNGDTLTAGGVYTALLTNASGCDSTVVLTLTELQPSGRSVEEKICEGESYNFEGNELTATGVYTVVYPNAVGCDSTITLTLTVFTPSPTTNLSAVICEGDAYEFYDETLTESGAYSVTFANEGGCDSVIVLSLAVLPNSSAEVEASICTGDSYEFYGDTLTAGGIYTAVLPNSLGCDSTITLTLTELSPSFNDFEASICEGESYDFDGNALTTGGTYTAVYTNAVGCDSTVTLKLSVFQHSEPTNIEATICANEPYLFNGDLLSTTGVYSVVFNNAAGCDSLVTLNLTVLPVSATDIAASICSGDSYDFNGDLLTEGGTYTAVLPNSVGCDSTITLTLTELESSETTLEITLCEGESYEFEGNTLTSGGVYTVTYPNTVGCDSTITLTLTVFPHSEPVEIAQTICAGESYAFDGNILTESGVYTATFTNANGCDSLVTLTLTALPGSSSATNIEASFCSGDSYDFNGDLLTEGGTYTAVLTNSAGCDSIVTLVLTELPASSSTIDVTLCADESYDFDGNTLTESGVYTAHYLNSAGCDSTVVLNLTINEPLGSALEVTICEESSYDFYGDLLTDSGVYTTVLTSAAGCDSTITLTLTVLEPDLTLLEDTFCAGSTYLFNGENLGSPGSYTALLTNIYGCDSLIVLELTELPAVNTSIEGVLCEGSSYDFNGQILTAPGVYTDVLTSSAGCDSTVTLTLNLSQPDVTLLEASICEGQSYPFNGQELDEPGVYTTELTNAVGCDSVVVLTLSVLPVSTTNLEATICAGESYEFNGQALTESGIYVEVNPGANGCDSSTVLTLTVREPDISIMDVSVCNGESYEFNGQTYTESGVYDFVYTNEFGCEATATLNLTVLPASGSTTEGSICANETYMFNGQEFSEAGTYAFILTNTAGCDSTAVLVLHVNPIYTSAFAANICEGQTYPFNGVDYAESGTYAAIFTSASGCDSLVTLNLNVIEADFSVEQQEQTLTVTAANAEFQWIDCATNQPIPGETTNTFTPAVTGSYAVQVSQNGCSATSGCFEVTIVSTENPVQAADWQLMPNPTSGAVQLVFDAPAAKALHLQVFDMTGRLCLEQIIPAGQSRTSVSLDRLSDGVFLARLKGGQFATKAQRIVKVSR